MPRRDARPVCSNPADRPPPTRNPGTGLARLSPSCQGPACRGNSLTITERHWQGVYLMVTRDGTGRDDPCAPGGAQRNGSTTGRAPSQLTSG